MISTEKSYEANYRSGLSFMKLALKEQALDCFNRAYGQVPEREKIEDNVIYLDILNHLANLTLEKSERGRSIRFVEEGLALKKDHADLLFLQSLLYMDEKRYDEALQAMIHYFLSLGEENAYRYNYRCIHEGALKEIYDHLLPTAYRSASEPRAIREVVDRLCKSTQNGWLIQAHEVMARLTPLRGDRENG